MMTLTIYDDKQEVYARYEKDGYRLIQIHFSDLMFCKNVLKINYRMTSKNNYDGTYNVTFKDMSNKFTFEFRNVNSESLRTL